MNTIKIFLEKRPKLKAFAISCISPSRRPRPRWWVRVFLTPIIHPKGKGTRFARRARIDIFPWHNFKTGRNVWVEDYAIINNGAGDVELKDRAWIGIGSVITGPAILDKNTVLGQYVMISGFNHGLNNPDGNTIDEPLDVTPVYIGENVFIGTNAVILSGVSVGKGSQIGAGSVVTKDIPPYSIAVGNPARIIKKYNLEKKIWEKA